MIGVYCVKFPTVFQSFLEKSGMQMDEEIEQGEILVETIYDMVGAAMNVPSVAMGQPTQFIVLNDIEALSRASEIVPVSHFTTQALAAIIVCGDLSRAQIKNKWMLDCEAAAHQLLQTAHAKGLGAYMSPIYPDRERMGKMTELLSLPEDIVAHSYVAMGYPVRVPSARDAMSNERVHYNSWIRKNSSSDI